MITSRSQRDPARFEPQPKSSSGCGHSWTVPASRQPLRRSTPEAAMARSERLTRVVSLSHRVLRGQHGRRVSRAVSCRCPGSSIMPPRRRSDHYGSKSKIAHARLAARYVARCFPRGLAVDAAELKARHRRRCQPATSMPFSSTGSATSPRHAASDARRWALPHQQSRGPVPRGYGRPCWSLIVLVPISRGRASNRAQPVRGSFESHGVEY